MDSSSYCSLASTTQQFWNDDDDAYVNAWSTPKYVKGPTGSCSYTFSDYGVDGLKFKFTRLDITDCSVKVNVYRQSFAYGTPDFTYNCYSQSSSYSDYHTASTGYVTIELVNPTYSRGFDFQFHVKNLDYSHGGSVAVGLSVGLSVGFIIFMVVLIVLCRRRRYRRMRGQPLIVAAATTTTTANYNYPVGQAPYPNSYGSVTQNNYAPPPAGAYPQQSGAYPPPAGAYPTPAGGYQQPSGAAPPPPVYSEKNEPPAGAYNPAGAAPYPPPPAYNN